MLEYDYHLHPLDKRQKESIMKQNERRVAMTKDPYFPARRRQQQPSLHYIAEYGLPWAAALAEQAINEPAEEEEA